MTCKSNNCHFGIVKLKLGSILTNGDLSILNASPPDLYIERFNIALGQYMGALQSIVPLFIYMNKFYIETKLNRDLKDDLIKLFTEHVADKHIYSLMPLLLEAQSTPFQVTPSTMANIVKGLYTLRPEWVQMAPTLFSKFIPNILPPAVESELSEYAAQDQKLQRDLIQNGFTRQVVAHFPRLLAWLQSA
ncbi:hypothetical protein H671_3g10303 [Cricetulus griseus]|uniref:CACUL1 n=1 Tax=Cricetulus griseus TaxID=10029 RepID=A0A061I896_CRIGR|nr:hypothetical protein H671_3g10303 [Cricetulus griseus]